MIRDIKKSILSGIMISVGCTVYMACRTMGLPWLGAILFSAGLFTICACGFNLYTGRVGYIAYSFKDTEYVLFVLLVAIFNLLTTFLIGIVISYTYPKIGAEAFNVYFPKLSNSLLRTFISACFCGLLMFLAVDTWKQGKVIGCFIFVPTFIFAGFDHSIANSFYNGAAFGLQIFPPEDLFLQDQIAKILKYSTNAFTCFSVRNALLVTVTVLGNAAGGMLVPLLMRRWKEKEV